MRTAKLAVLSLCLLAVAAFGAQSSSDLQTIDTTRAWLKAIEPHLTAIGVTNARNISTRLNTLKGQWASQQPVDAVLSSLTVAPTSVVGGAPATATVTLEAAVSTDTVVALAAGNTARATVPASVTIPANATSATATVTTLVQTATVGVQLSATLGTVVKTATLTLTSGVTPPPPPPPPARNCNTDPTSAAHPYYDATRAKAECLSAYSLRSSAQLQSPANGGYAHSNSRTLVVTYDYANDPDPRKQDGAKITITTASNSLSNQVRVPIPAYGTDPLLVTWDAWFGKEWNYSTSGILAYKTFQLASVGNIWTEVRNRFNFGAVGYTDVRYYGAQFGQWGPGTVSAGTVNGRNYGVDAVGPLANEFAVAPETWTRYWAYFNPAAGGTWTEFSLWVADSGRDPVLVLDKRLIQPRTLSSRWDSLWFEYNTSQSTVKVGRPDLISYVRNVVMLKGVAPSAVSSLLIRP